jgi:hypothetical protein
MRLATVCLRETRFFLHASSRTTAGVWVLSGACSALDAAASDEELGTAVKFALSTSRTNVEHPTSWDGLFDPVLELAHVDSWPTFVRGASCSTITEDDEGMTVIPWTPRGGGRGFEPMAPEARVIKGDSIVELGRVVREMLAGSARRMGDKARAAQAKAERNAEESAPIVADLRKAGFRIERLGDLRTIKGEPRYAKAVPVLLGWLRRAPSSSVRAIIAEALDTPIAKPVAARPLVEEFRRVEAVGGLGFDDWSARWTIGNPLQTVADDSIADDLVELARDRRYGRAREPVVRALGSLSADRAVQVLVELLGDDEVCGQAVVALGKLRAVSARQAILPFLKHPVEWIRREALRAVRSIDRAT